MVGFLIAAVALQVASHSPIPNEIRVQIASVGQSDTAAQAFRVTAYIKGSGSDFTSSAKAAKDKRRAIEAALRAAGIAGSSVGDVNRKLGFIGNAALQSDDGPQVPEMFPVVESLAVDATDSEQADRVIDVMRANGAMSVSEPVPMLLDFVTARRNAKADALVKASAEAAAYAARLSAGAPVLLEIAERPTSDNESMMVLMQQFSPSIVKGAVHTEITLIVTFALPVRAAK